MIHANVYQELLLEALIDAKIVLMYVSNAALSVNAKYNKKRIGMKDIVMQVAGLEDAITDMR